MAVVQPPNSSPSSARDRTKGRAELAIPLELAFELEGLAHAAEPQEVCGLLLGPRGAELRGLALWPANNLEQSRCTSRFELDPAAVVAAERWAGARDWHILGVWHSHPKGPLRLSRADRRGAWSGWLQLVVVPGLGLRAFEGRGNWRVVAMRLLDTAAKLEHRVP